MANVQGVPPLQVATTLAPAAYLVEAPATNAAVPEQLPVPTTTPVPPAPALLPPVLVVVLMQRWFVKGLVETEK